MPPFGVQHKLLSPTHVDSDPVATPADQNVPTYDAATARWIPQAPAPSVTDHGALTGLAEDDHPQYGALAQAETWAALQAFSAGIQLAAGQAIKDGAGVARITLSAATPNVLVGLDAGEVLRINTGTDEADMEIREFTDGEGVYQQLAGTGSAGDGSIEFGRISGGVSRGLRLGPFPVRLTGAEIIYSGIDTVLDVQSTGASAGSALDFTPISALADGTATAAQTGKVWSAIKSRLVARGTVGIPDFYAIDALVTRATATGTFTGGMDAIRAGVVNDATVGAFVSGNVRGINVLAPSGAANFKTTGTMNVIGIDVGDVGAKLGNNVYGIRIAAITGGTTRYGLNIADIAGGTARILELGPTPYLRLLGSGSWTPAANQTPLYVAEGATPTLRQVQWKDGGSIAAGDKVMVLV